MPESPARQLHVAKGNCKLASSLYPHGLLCRIGRLSVGHLYHSYPQRPESIRIVLCDASNCEKKLRRQLQNQTRTICRRFG